MKITKKERGITLIGLAIKVIVLLILAGIVIASLAGDNGIIAQARNARDKHNAGQIVEEESLQGTADVLNNIKDRVDSGQRSIENSRRLARKCR